MKVDEVVGHLKKGKTDRFVKTVSYYMADKNNSCTAIVKGKHVNLGDGEAMQVPCILLTWTDMKCSTERKNSIKSGLSSKHYKILTLSEVCSSTSSLEFEITGVDLGKGKQKIVRDSAGVLGNRVPDSAKSDYICDFMGDNFAVIRSLRASLHTRN